MGQGVIAAYYPIQGLRSADSQTHENPICGCTQKGGLNGCPDHSQIQTAALGNPTIPVLAGVGFKAAQGISTGNS